MLSRKYSGRCGNVVNCIISIVDITQYPILFDQRRQQSANAVGVDFLISEYQPEGNKEPFGIKRGKKNMKKVP
jgi:hypothetical protein